ncbi:hypothetical protein DL765_009493 [Monosporascus sp. GIB2]|nr:hypothetical protein DL765_009493 [Monosporascus sp. GIB2]
MYNITESFFQSREAGRKTLTENLETLVDDFASVKERVDTPSSGMKKGQSIRDVIERHLHDFLESDGLRDVTEKTPKDVADTRRLAAAVLANLKKRDLGPLAVPQSSSPAAASAAVPVISFVYHSPCIFSIVTAAACGFASCKIFSYTNFRLEEANSQECVLQRTLKLTRLSSLFGHTADQHYKWPAIWQVVPLSSVIVQWALHRAGYFLLGSIAPRDDDGRLATRGIAFSVAVSGIYEFALMLCVATHLPIVALALLPAPLRLVLGSGFVSLKPNHRRRHARADVRPVPGHRPSDCDARGSRARRTSRGGDQLIAAMIKNPSFGNMLRRARFWFFVGGPIAATAALLRERDEVVKEGEVVLKSKTSQVSVEGIHMGGPDGETLYNTPPAAPQEAPGIRPSIA